MTSFFRRALLLAVGFWLLTFYVYAQQAPALGTFYDFNVVGTQRVNNSGTTVIGASVASVQNNMTGSRPTVLREVHEKNATADRARTDALAAYNAAIANPVTTTLTDPNLGNRTFTPGVYEFNGNTSVAGDLTLDGGFNPNAVFIFIIRGSLTIAANTQMKLDRDARSANVFWIVEQGISVGESASLIGNFLAKKSIVMRDGAQLRGRLASLDEEVRLSQNLLSIPADLAVTIQKTSGQTGTDRYIVGETITYTITARNNGPTNEENVRVEQVLFTGNNPTYTSTAPNSLFSRDPVTGTWQWNIGKLDYGQTVSLTITATINETGNGFIRGVIAGAGVDEIRGNNTAELNFCVVLPDAGVITGPTDLCVDSKGVYSIEPIAGATRYNWNVPSGWVFTVEDQSKPYIITVTAGRNKGAVTVSVNNTCGETPLSRLAVNNYPDPPVKPGPIAANEGVCAGSSATYSVAPVADATKYSWTVPQGWTITSGQGTNQITVSVGTSAGKVTVRAENVCGVSDPVEREVQPFLSKPAMPSAITGSGTLQFCASTNRVTFSVTAQGDVTRYVWEVPSAWTIIEGQGSNTITVNPNGVGGTVSVKGLNACGEGPARTFTVTVVTGPPAIPGEISGAFPVCGGSSGIKYSIAPVPTATGYTWYVPDGWTITAGQGTNEITVSVGANARSGQIIVQALNDCGSSGNSRKDVTITGEKAATPTVIRGAEFGCSTKTTTYETDPVAGAQSYTWTVPSGWTITGGQGTTRITVTIGTQAGNVTVTASNSCGESAPKSLAVKPFTAVPTKPISISGPKEVCVGQLEAIYSLQPVDNTLEYIWAVPSGWTIISGQFTTQIVVKVGTSSGNITVTASNPCGSSSPATLPVAPVADVPAPKPGAINGQAQYCAGLNQVYSIDPVQGAASYFWSFPGTDWVIVEGQGTTRVTVKAGATQGQVTVATVNNCGTKSSASALTVVSVGTVPPTPSAITSDREAYCGNTQSLVFRIAAVPTATGYTWTVPAGWTITAGQGTTQITANAGTSGGEVTVVAINSCGNSQSVKLLTEPQRTLTNPEVIQGPAIPCTGSTNAVYTVPAISGAETYLWTLPAGWTILEGAGTNRIRVKVTGEGKITVKARNTCGTTAESAMDVKVVTAVPLTPVAITGKAIACATRTTTYSISEVANASSYSWSVPTGWSIVAGQGSTQITVQVGTNSGEVRVEAVNDCGKSAASKLVVASSLLPSISRIVDKTTACSEMAVYELEANGPVNTYIWTVPNGWEIISGQGTTSITVMQGRAKGEVTVVADNGLCQSDPVSLLSDPSQRDANLIIPNVFSPNNDGNNDNWEIGGLLNYPDNNLVVMNRWGNEVYKSQTYKNNWNGDKLAEGTYYYLLRLTLCDGTEKVYKGYVMIVR